MTEYDCGPLDQGMRAAQAGGCAVLLVRHGDMVRAISNICPHAGAKLSDGVLHGDQVICPWHKAAFDLRSGVCTAPPAVDDVPRFSVRLVDGRALVRVPGTLPRARPRSPDPRCLAIVGAGAAGAMAAQTLRAEGFGGRVVMIGRENLLPYDRTLLSKYTLSGQQGGEKTPLQSAYFYHRHQIERMTQPVMRLDAHARVLHFADGSMLGYDAALIATGATPRRPHIDNGALRGVFTLRGAADADAIVGYAGQARDCVVLGAGFIGMEAAASLRERGLRVAVVTQDEAPFAHQLGATIGNALAGLHRDAGISFHTGRNITALTGDHAVTGAVLDNGETLPADMVVIGLGVTPTTELLGPMIERKDRGATVDAHLRLADGLFAAGDIAAFPPAGGGPPIRVEHWRVAQQHGRTAALNMLGANLRMVATPYFWTIHFRKRLDYVGHAEQWDDVVVDGDVGARNFIAYYIRSGRVAAVAGMDRDRQMAAVIPLMDERPDWTVAELRTWLDLC